MSAPVSDVLADRLGRHRLWTLALRLHRVDGAVPAETVEAVRRFTDRAVLQLVLIDEAAGVAFIRGSKSTIEDAFSRRDASGRRAGPGMRMVVVEQDGVRWRAVAGELALPDELRGRVLEVSGLDTRPGAPPLVPAEIG